MADVVVLLPGITGSVLRDSAGNDLWAPTAGTVARALVTLGRSITDLELRHGDADDGVTAPMTVPDLHLIPGLWKIDGYSKLSAYLQRQLAVTPGKNFFQFPYDWRRDNRISARRLKEQADRWLWEWRQESPQAKLILVAHSMGGLVARYFLECLDGWRDTRRLVTFGTPYRGSLNALNFLVNGMQKRLGPVPVLDLSQLLRSFPSVYQLLPIYPCLDPGDGTLIRVFEAAGLPHVDPQRARAADGFHREIEQAVTAHLDDEEYRRGRYTIHPVVGTFQSTLLSARWSSDGVGAVGTYPGVEPDGDGTVPRMSATPIEFPLGEGAMFAAERHGSLQHNDGVLVQLAGLLSEEDTSRVRAGADAGLELDDAYGPGEPVSFRFRAADPMASLTAVVTAVGNGAEVARLELGAAGDWCADELAPPPPGAYRLTLGGEGVEPVTDTFVVIGEQDPIAADVQRYTSGWRVRGGEISTGGWVRGGEPEARVRSEPHEEPAIAESPRWILAKVFDTSDGENPQELKRAFRAGAPHEIVAMVGRSGDWEGALSATGRPEESVDSKLPAGPAELAVMLFIPTLGVSDVRHLRLPTSGPSEKVPFGFTAPSAGQRIDGSISLLYRGKILQTAILSGSAFEDPWMVPPGFEMTFRLAVIRPVTDDVVMRPSFDAALVTGRKDAMPVAVGVLDTETVVPFHTGHLARIVDRIRVQLKVLTENPAAFVGLNSDATLALLLALARQGRDLYELLGSKLEEALPGRDLSRIQVVLTDPSDFIPVEFIYDFPTPSQGAGLCSNWRKALEEGRCDPKYHPPAARPQQVGVVCPLGFWGLKKVIERQAVDADDAALVEGKDFAIRAEPTVERPRLDRLDSALFAWSDKVNATVEGQSDTVLETLDAVTGNQAVTARTWEEWVAAISERGPSLLVLLSHTVTDRGSTKLEIGPDGTGSRCERIEVVQEWVKRDPTATPVVLLLGCDTAVARNDPQTFVARFRDVGAALVVGTIVPVLGEHAAPVASALVQTLRSLTDSHAQRGSNGLVAQAESGLGKSAWTFGDAMVAVRRQLLASGELTALCVTAFGDASWRLGEQSADTGMTCSG
jgi:hypothetical protein